MDDLGLYTHILGTPSAAAHILSYANIDVVMFMMFTFAGLCTNTPWHVVCSCWLLVDVGGLSWFLAGFLSGRSYA